MPSPNTSVTVNRHTANKLRQIARHLEIPTAQVVERLADNELKALGLDRPALPEVSVILHHDGDDVRLIIDFASETKEPARYHYTLDGARQLADENRKCADGTQERSWIDLDHGSVLTVERRGAGVIVADPLNKPPFRLGLNPTRARLVAAEIAEATV